MSTPALGPGRTERAPEPLDQSSDLGMLVVFVAAVALALLSWTLFPTDARGMWAGYCSSGLAILAIVANCSLRTSLARPPAVGVIVLSGLGLITLGLFEIGHTKVIPISQITCGALLVVGGGLQA